MANVGLIFFMFLVGMEMDADILKTTAKQNVVISTIGVLVPFALSIPVSVLLFKPEWALDANFGTFFLFVGVAMGISALPVLARILSERHMLEQKLGVITMSATAIDDMEGWVLLALVVSIARAGNYLSIIWTVLLTLANLVMLYILVRPLLQKINQRVELCHEVSINMFFVVFLILFVFSWLTDWIGLSAMFGAFEVGCMIPRSPRLISELTVKLEGLITVVFLPLYFTFSGLRTKFTTLDDATSWGLCLLVFVVAFTSKVLGCGLSAKFIGKMTNKEALCFGILMQTKGLVALIVFNLGLEYEVISPKLFAVNVVMVLLSTIITTPLVEWIYPVKKMQEEALIIMGNDDSLFSLVLETPTTKYGRAMTAVGDILIQGRGRKSFSHNITAFKLVDETESTSYVSALINKYGIRKNGALNAVKERAKAINLKVACSTYNTTGETATDLVTFARSKGANLLIVSHPNRKFIGHILKEATFDVGFLLDRSTIQLHANKVLFPLIGEVKQYAAALKYAVMMSKAVGIEIILLQLVAPGSIEDVETHNSLVSICTNHTSMKYVVVINSDSRDAVMKEWTVNPTYSLLLLGDILPSEEDIITNCPCSVLQIYSKSGSVFKDADDDSASLCSEGSAGTTASQLQILSSIVTENS